MTAREELKPVLARLRDEQPGVLSSYPSLGPDLVVGTPPIKIHLTPWAADAAEELHRQFGDDVELTVGFLPYPPGRPLRPRQGGSPGQVPAPLDPGAVTVELDGLASVSSGHTLHHHLTVHNLASSELQIATNGGVTAVVVDPQTGETVGGFSGAQTLALKFFRVFPGGSVRLPLLIGTASSRPELGYTVPPGEWGIQVTLELRFGPQTDLRIIRSGTSAVLGSDPSNSLRRRTPILPLTITA